MTAPDNSTILGAYDAMFADLVKHWIAGVPDQNDLRAIRQRVSRELSIPIVAVAEALAERAAAARAQ